jgi:type I restriction enzyme S subunit
VTHCDKTAEVNCRSTWSTTALRLATAPDVKAQAPLATILARQGGELSARDLWQRFGRGIDDFYAQLKTEVAHGWIAEPALAEMRELPSEKAAETAGA